MPLHDDNRQRVSPSEFEPALLIDDLRKDFSLPRRKRNRAMPGAESQATLRAVDGISLRAAPGKVTALLGANGAGKSTTLSCAQGLLKPTAGRVRLLGEDPWRAGPSLRARVGIMLQEGGLPQAIRPIPLLRHVASMYRKPADVDALVSRLGIDGFDRTNIRRLSGGQRQRVALAAALVGDPEVLFLDEPSAGLDPQSRHVVFDLVREVKESGTCIVLTTHLMDDAQRLADDVYIVDEGRNVVEGQVDDLLNNSQDRKTLRFAVSRRGMQLLDVFPAPLAEGLTLREEHAGSYEISGPIRPEHLSHLTGTWAELGELPTSLELKPRSLEDLFLDISGRTIR